MKNVLIVVDMQKDFVNGALGTPEAQAIVPAVETYLQNAASDTEILFTRDTHSEDYPTTREGRHLPVPHCIRDTDGWQIIPELLPYAEKAQILGIPTHPFTSGCLDGFTVVVDCLLGTGFQGSLRENYRAAIEEINATPAYVVSVDINSGMNGDTGDAELAVNSDLTVTIGYVKNGLLSENAGKHMKRLVCTDIGIVLVREENKICAVNEPPLADAFRCPPWLNMEIIKAY